MRSLLQCQTEQNIFTPTPHSILLTSCISLPSLSSICLCVCPGPYLGTTATGADAWWRITQADAAPSARITPIVLGSNASSVVLSNLAADTYYEVSASKVLKPASRVAPLLLFLLLPLRNPLFLIVCLPLSTTSCKNPRTPLPPRSLL